MKKIAKVAFPIAMALLLAGCGEKQSGGSAGSQIPTAKPSVQETNQNKNASVTQNNSNSNSNYVINDGDVALFWGQGCPHCTNVENFLKENPDVSKKYNIKQFEVFNDKEGQKLFALKAKECNLQSLGVPTLYKNGTCLQGDEPIINELKK